MKTIELIKKLSELGRLVESFESGRILKLSMMEEAFEAEVRKVAGELIDYIGIPLEHGNQDEQNEIIILSAKNPNYLFQHFLQNYLSDEYQSTLALAVICHKMGVELGASNE